MDPKEDYLPLSKAVAGSSLEQIFLVVNCQTDRDTNKNPYLRLTVRDVTKEMMMFAWGVAQYIKPGSYIFANAQAKEHKGKLVLTTQNVTVVPKPHNVDRFVRGEAASKLDVISTEMDLLIGKIYDPDLSEIIGYVKKLHLIENMREFPYVGRLDHTGGLLIHTFNLLKLCLAQLQATSHLDAEINRDMVIAGCLCRNLSYMNCFSLNGDIWTPNRYGAMFGMRTTSWSYTRDVLIGVESDIRRPLDENKKWDLMAIVSAPEGDKMSQEAAIVVHAETLLNNLYASKY